MPFSSLETGILVRALACAPSVHNTQPWELSVEDDLLRLRERTDVQLPRHDPSGRDRLMSCGAALANVELASRTLGRAVEVSVRPDPARPELVAELRVVGHAELSEAEAGLYHAIFRRRSYRAPFAYQGPSHGLLRTLAESATTAGVEVHLVHSSAETKALADLLSYAGGVLHDDRAYQRELSAWSALFPRPLSANSTLPWSGLVQGTTHVPDRITLYNRLSGEAMLIVHTPADGPRDHILAGAALQRLWLAAIAQGLVGSVLTQPLQLPEVRLGVAERLHLPGHPQALLRTGYPVTGLPVDGAIAYQTGAR
ncbi:Acg family FMN-binding oxidoreductase [Labedaea rhizosphaerae]|uniref:Nitroreductase family protein n=1 Tax=Labedaea rhizosphaerae TaxID=598644 RepID=A0A4R6SHR7_LABRH|nr:nitroreductase family protein [Labedaea rhizosphaerae]TDQ00409.1 nitroreductase family protein [Labedaea rhizosphaerae]